ADRPEVGVRRLPHGVERVPLRQRVLPAPLILAAEQPVRGADGTRTLARRPVERAAVARGGRIVTDAPVRGSAGATMPDACARAAGAALPAGRAAGTAVP